MTQDEERGKKKEKKREYTFDETRYTCEHDEKIYGEIEYNHSTRILSLTNRDVSLSRKYVIRLYDLARS